MKTMVLKVIFSLCICVAWAFMGYSYGRDTHSVSGTETLLKVFEIGYIKGANAVIDTHHAGTLWTEDVAYRSFAADSLNFAKAITLK